MGAGTAPVFPLGSRLTTDAGLCLPALTVVHSVTSSLFSSVSLFSSRLRRIFSILLRFSGVKIHFHGVVELSPWFPPLSPRLWPPVFFVWFFWGAGGVQTGLWVWASSASGPLSTNSPTSTPGLSYFQYQKMRHASSCSRLRNLLDPDHQTSNLTFSSIFSILPFFPLSNFPQFPHGI